MNVVHATTGKLRSLHVNDAGELLVAGAGGGVGTGDASAANQTTEIARLTTLVAQTDGLEASAASIDTKTPALGQALAAASTPVVLTAIQVAALTPPAAITGFATQATLAAIDGHVDGLEASATSIDGKLPALGKKATSGSLAASAKSGGDEYETVAASQTTQAMGATGAVGDYLEGVLCVVSTAATSQVQIKDGSNAAITIFPNSPGAGVGSYYIPLGLTSVQGAWQITTGAGVSVIGIGDFT